ncbi:hypothetical protein ACFYTS_21180 [Nocardia sp. NPDC004151]|uniref:hypothetical protein n=1 Tax=Nocardia sp. NPDC004151 TaxID=3364304 RepID=UPI0036AD7B90
MSDTTIHATDVTAAASAVDLLANNILANPEIASHYLDPAGVIVELAARVRHLRTRLAGRPRRRGNQHRRGSPTTPARSTTGASPRLT